MKNKIPLGISNVLNLFSQNNLQYNLFKCEHIFHGENKNLDILFLQKKDYVKAGNILNENNFVCYMPEKIEKYKQMWVKVDFINKKPVLTAIHLHREIAWHGIKVLNKNNIFAKEIKLNENIIVPSPEDSLLIHLAHIIFENHKIRVRDKRVLKELLKTKLDWEYIMQVAKYNCFVKQLRHVLDCYKKNRQPNKKTLYMAIIKNVSNNPSLFLYLNYKLIKSILRMANIRRKGCLIVLVGVNGAGKTTLAKELLKSYKPITDFFNGQKGYYFGWNPFLPTTKLLSGVLKLKKKKIFDEKENEIYLKPKNISLFSEFLFVYNYFEYLGRYLFHIYPALRRGELIICDRYFYDMKGQYNSKSFILPILLKSFPKANSLFILQARPSILSKRGKDNLSISGDVKGQRKKRSFENLIIQNYNYVELLQDIDGNVIDSEKQIVDNIAEVINQTSEMILHG